MNEGDRPTVPGDSGGIIALDELQVDSVVEERYRLDRQIGAGGMGTVWRAHDVRLGRDVAIKVVALNHPLTRARFVREGKVAARLDHPGLCRIYDVGERGGVGHLVMELLAGETVYRRMTNSEPARAWCLSLVAEVARAMAAAHAQSLVHRDLKPDNIFLDNQGAQERAVVIDFGLAFMDGDGQGELGRLTQRDITGGTPAYMAPEQARALAIGPPADVYALGCVLFELLSGRPPFEGPAAVVMSSHVFATPPALAELVGTADPGVDELVAAMLSKLPVMRPTMPSVVTRLEALLTGPGPIGRAGSPGLRVHRMITRSIVEATRAEPVGEVLGAVLAIGPVPDEVLVAAASAGLAAERATAADAAARLGAQPRAIVLADVDDAAVVALCGLGAPVIAVAPLGDLDAAARLARIGCVDVLTRPIQPDLAARKLVRALRRLPSGPS